MKSVISAIVSFFEGVRNIFYWMPVVYRDKNFDEHYFYKIIHHKLSDMERTFIKDDSFIISAMSIRKAKAILQRLIDDNYYHERVKGIDTKAFIQIKKGKYTVDREHPDFDRWSQAGEEAERDRDHDKEEFFDILSTEINGWWY
ncbi:hypothetical protein M2277_004973 [Paenibacillus sp. LBL]|uniref:hypothetical protein n=1 Tax=Paenibacillus sp. LBL TaxID=2940563 RepID=UPI002475F8F1|nr:hypothetical protein [Paenibacillus sp. LBL]MDH6674281.1 hypothetical protein [Paenibacillus sp. LBL]